MFKGLTAKCFIVTAILAAAGCAMNDAERVASVSTGMTPQQVERYMGRAQSVHFEFDGAGYSRYFQDIDPLTKTMTTARAVALPPDWSSELKDWLAETAKTSGPLKRICTVHRLGTRDYECCFENGKLRSMNVKIWPRMVH